MIDRIRTSAPNPGSHLENGVYVDRLNSSCFCISWTAQNSAKPFGPAPNRLEREPRQVPGTVWG
jgi:hypothetical protein